MTPALSTLPADQLIIDDEEKDDAQRGEISCQRKNTLTRVTLKNWPLFYLAP